MLTVAAAPASGWSCSASNKADVNSGAVVVVVIVGGIFNNRTKHPHGNSEARLHVKVCVEAAHSSKMAVKINSLANACNSSYCHVF